jgi:DNA-binding GntR family transcriptional regulator
MPVPVPASQTPAPRRLLRDVVYDKMFEAIIDGTLELGERLNDDELVNWLGVSRTPVREAIAKLAEQRLVDIEANRYTRVIAPTLSEFVDTVQTGTELQAVLARRAVPQLTDAQLKEAQGLLSDSLSRLAKGKLADPAAYQGLIQLCLRVAGSPTLDQLFTMTGPRLALMYRRVATAGVEPLAMSAESATAFAKALQERDGIAAAELILKQLENPEAYLEAVKATEVFPEKATRR